MVIIMRKRSTKYVLASLIAVFFVLLGCKQGANDKTAVQPAQQSTPWVSLFNGKDLSGWSPKIKGYAYGENWQDTFRVEDSVIKVSYDGYDGQFKARYGHLFYKSPLSNYRLKLEYRFTGDQIADGAGWAKRNSGVMIHCQAPETMTLAQDFPLSIEVQMLGGLTPGEERPTGNLCTPGTHVVVDGELATAHCMDSSSDTFYGDQWVSLEIEVRSDSITHTINGVDVLHYAKPQIGGDLAGLDESIVARKGELLTGGYISLQSESHPVEFRRIFMQAIE